MNHVGPDAFVRGRLPRLREADECVRRYVISPGAFAVDSRTTSSGSIAISEG
jgi:hypothetical protein